MAIQMQRYITEQPAIWQDILLRRQELTAPLRKALDRKQPKRILMVGTGSSANAAAIAAPLWEELVGKEVTLASPTRLGTVLPNPATTLVLVISQSGRSTSTLQAAQRLKKAGFSVAAVTADPNSPVALAASFHLHIACGEETVGPKTKGFTATVLTLYIAALTLAELWKTADEPQICAITKALEVSFQCAPENLVRCRGFCEKHMAAFAPPPHYTFIADGIGLPIAAESALKVLETLYVPAFAYEFEEYLHGIQNTIDPGQFHFFLFSGKENAPRMGKLLAFCDRHHCVDFAVSTLDLPNPPPNLLTLLGSGRWYTQPFEVLLFFQLFSALGSAYKGFEVDTPKFDSFYSEMQTKL